MTWEIRLPRCSGDERLIDVASLVRRMPGQDEDREVARQLVLSAMLDGEATFGELHDRIEAMTPDARRGLLDEARVEVGLRPSREIDADERYEALQAEGRRRVAVGLQSCAAADCHALPMTPEGALRPVHVRRWWCEAHRDQAAEGDMHERGLSLRISPCGALVEVDAAEEARAAAADASRRAQLAAEAEARAVEAEALRAHEQARRERFERETPRAA